MDADLAEKTDHFLDFEALDGVVQACAGTGGKAGVRIVNVTLELDDGGIDVIRGGPVGARLREDGGRHGRWG